MAITFDDVKAVLDYCVGANANWNRIARRHRNPHDRSTDPNLFGWETEEQLLSAKARGHWLINPEFRGNGKGDQTNLVKILTDPDGLFGYPRMPLVGKKIEFDSEHCRVLIEWIDSLPCIEEKEMKTDDSDGCSPEERFKALGDEIPPYPDLPPNARFVQAKQVGEILYISGMGPQRGTRFDPAAIGKIWEELTIEQGYAAARLTGINLLHVVRRHLGSLDSVAEVLEVFGMVNGAPSFNKNPQVLDGCSQLFEHIFGDSGKHVRTASGSDTPFDIAVYIKMSVRVKEDKSA